MKHRMLYFLFVLIPCLCQALSAGCPASANETSWEDLYNKQVAGQPAGEFQSAPSAGNVPVQNAGTFVPVPNFPPGNCQTTGWQSAGTSGIQSGFQTVPSTPVLNSAVLQGQVNQTQLSRTPVLSSGEMVGNGGVLNGVDILDESLKYQAASNRSGSFMPVNQNGNMMQANQFGAMCGGQASGVFNGNGCYSMQNQMSNMSGAGTAFNGNANMANGYGSCGSGMMNNMGNMNGMMMNNMNGGNNGLFGLNSRQVGAIGAAAMMGVFLQSGGLGGILRSMNWDPHFHTRGQSIGGY